MGARPERGPERCTSDGDPTLANAHTTGTYPRTIRRDVSTVCQAIARPRSAEDPPLTAPTGAPARLPRKATEGECSSPRHFPVGVASASSNCFSTSTSVHLIEYRGPSFRCLVAEHVVVKTTKRRTRPPVCLYGRFPASSSAPRGYEPPLLMRSAPKQAIAGAPSHHASAQTPTKNDQLATEVIAPWSTRWTSIPRYLHGPSGSSPS